MSDDTTPLKGLPTVTAPHGDGPRRVSTVLHELAASAAGPVAIGQVRDALGDRGVAVLLAFFAAINLLPLPPGTTILLGPPLVIVAIQVTMGQSRIWLPRLVLRKSVKEERFRQLVARSLPRLLWLEHAIKPRYWPFSRPAVADAVVGGICLFLSIAVTVPIPLGNWLPALAVFLIALALSERDGILLAAGIVVGVLSLVVIGGIVGAAHALYGSIFP